MLLSRVLFQVHVPMDLKGFVTTDLVGLDIKGGHRSFVARAVSLVTELDKPGCMAPVASFSAASSDPYLGMDTAALDAALQAALVKALAPKAAVAVHVEVRPLLKESCHLHDIDHRLMPESVATDCLATKHAALLKRGVNKPFVLVKLDGFLPSWCPIGDNAASMCFLLSGSFCICTHLSDSDRC